MCAAVGTTDRLVRIFDCSLIGTEQSPEEAEEGPPEIVFVHGGHVAGISELDWNPLDDEFPWVNARGTDTNTMLSPPVGLWGCTLNSSTCHSPVLLAGHRICLRG